MCKFHTFLTVGSGKTIRQRKAIELILCSFTFLDSGNVCSRVVRLSSFKSFCFLVELVPSKIFFKITSESPFMGLRFYRCLWLVVGYIFF